MTAVSTNPDINKFNALAQSSHLQAFSVDFSRFMSRFTGIFENVESRQPREFYPRIGAIADVQAYDEGEAPYTALKDYTMQLDNELFGLAVSIQRSVIDDMDTMPAAKSRYLARIQEMANRAAYKPYLKWIGILLANTETSYDEKTIFATDHVTGDNTVTTADGATSSDTESQLRKEHNLVVGHYADMTDDQGKKLHPQPPRDFIILCDPEYELAYQTLYYGQYVPINGTSTPVHGSNLMGSMGSVTVIGWSELSGQDVTYYIDATNSMGVRAGTMQMRERPTLEYLGPGSSPYILGDQHVWKLRMRFNVMVNEHAKIVRVDKSGS